MAKKTRQRCRRMTFLEYVESDPTLELPAANASLETFGEYLSRAKPLIDGHEDEPGSGLLAWRVGQVLTWAKERFDNGQADLGDGKKSTFIPHEFRTDDGDPPIIKVDTIEEMERLAQEKVDKYGLMMIGTKDDDEITCPRVMLIHRRELTSLDDLKDVVVLAEIRVDPSGKWD